MRHCEWQFKVGDQVVVVDDMDGTGDPFIPDGKACPWTTKVLGVTGKVVQVDDEDPKIPYRVLLDEEHPDHRSEMEQSFWFREHNLQAVKDDEIADARRDLVTAIARRGSKSGGV